MNRKLKAYRILKNLNQKDVADLLGVGLATYCNKENGKIPFTLSEAKKLADLFETKVDNIFFDNSVPNMGTASTA